MSEAPEEGPRQRRADDQLGSRGRRNTVATVLVIAVAAFGLVRAKRAPGLNRAALLSIRPGHAGKRDRGEAGIASARRHDVPPECRWFDGQSAPLALRNGVFLLPEPQRGGSEREEARHGSIGQVLGYFPLL